MKKPFLIIVLLAITSFCNASSFLPGEEDLINMTNPASFPNPTDFNCARGRAFHRLTTHYLDLLKQSEASQISDTAEELLNKYLSKTKLITHGGLLIQSDYEWSAIPIEAGITIGEDFKRPDLAAPYCVKTGTAGMKELLRIYTKHWASCPHRVTHPYKTDWHLFANHKIYRCCFAVIPLFQKYYVPHQHYTHEFFIQAEIDGQLEKYNDDPRNFTEALIKIREIVGVMPKQNHQIFLSSSEEKTNNH